VHARPDLIGQQPTAELRIGAVGVEHDVRDIRVGQLSVANGMSEPAVIGAGGQASGPGT
jgi:hypothetical protein